MSGDLASLAGKYTLTRVDDKGSCEGRVTLEIAVDPNDANKLRLHTKVANALGCTATLEEGKLKGYIISTQMMGSAGQMKVEHILSRGLAEGMEYKLEDKVLKMTCKTGSLEWTVV